MGIYLTKSTLWGVQRKYIIDNYLYKIDEYGYESIAEALTSEF